MGKDGKVLNTPSNNRQDTSSKRRPLQSEVLDYEEAVQDESRPLSYRSLKVYYPPGYNKQGGAILNSKFINRLAQ